MKRSTPLVPGLVFCFVTAAVATGQEKPAPEPSPKREPAPIVHPIHLGRLEMGLEQLEVSLEALELNLNALSEIEIAALPSLSHLSIPPVPPLPPLPPLAPEISAAFHAAELDLLDPGMHFDAYPGEDLSDEELLRVEAMRSIGRRDADKAIPVLREIVAKDSSPALRAAAVRLLGKYLEDSRVAPLLGEVAQNDPNLRVRTLAIRMLGKSRDPRAVEILEKLIRE